VKNLNYQSYYDGKVAELYYTKEELEKIVTLSNELEEKENMPADI
jgi:hypothetical protein